MYCLAGIGGGVTDCAKRTLERAGFKEFTHIRVTDLGMQKGDSAVTPERVAAVAERVRCAFGTVAEEENR